ncbi:Hypothetical predicted protein [Paramuricea clavata]|uniref:Uncharacterized protein n=1 Tax=Paramuricea clavata TaxID=317549 RepID=A0A6S7J392_PARCT|nr:Hypothetical predicted protein [Paramuricea clavata]
MAWHFVLNFLNVGFFAQALLTVVCVYLVYKCTKYVFGKEKATSEQPLKPDTVGRCLGHREAIFDLFSVERGGTGNICLTVSLTSKQSLSHQHVRDALVLLAKRQPMLRAIITTIANGDKYFEVKEIKEVITMLDITTFEVKASDWKDVWFENTEKQRGNGLLWRVVILQEEFVSDTKDYANTLMFRFNHSSTDGVSCVKFCKQFLTFVNEIADGATVDQEIPSLNILPYFHDIVTQKRTLYSVLNFMLTYCGLRPILRFFMQRFIARRLETTKCNPYYSQFPPSLDVSSFAGPNRLSAKVFTESETKNIIQACKANNCTVTGALTAAAHLAFCELIQDGMKGNKDAKLKCECAINAQRCCDPKPHEDYLGYFVYVFNELYMKYETGTDVNFWKMAQETTNEIHDFVKTEGYIINETIICETMKPRELVDQVDREVLIRFSCCNFISSFGSFNFDQNQEEQTYKLQECFVNSLNHGFAETFLHLNHTINGKMSWSIVSDVSRVESRHAEKFASLCFGRFIEIARGRA